jgi:hypothetical protein
MMRRDINLTEQRFVDNQHFNVNIIALTLDGNRIAIRVKDTLQWYLGELPWMLTDD